MALSTMALLVIYSYVSLFFFVKIFGGLNRIRSYFHDFIMDQLVEVVRLAGGQQLNSSVAVVIILWFCSEVEVRSSLALNTISADFHLCLNYNIKNINSNFGCNCTEEVIRHFRVEWLYSQLCYRRGLHCNLNNGLIVINCHSGVILNIWDIKITLFIFVYALGHLENI